MNSNPSVRPTVGAAAMPTIRRSEILHSLIPLAARLANAQLDAFSARLANALMAFSQTSKDPQDGKLAFQIANLLKNNQYAFYHLASRRLEQALQQEVLRLEQPQKPESVADAAGLSLVSYDEMDHKVSLGTVSRLFEGDNETALTALNTRLSTLLGRDALVTSQNPFRPEVFLAAINATWPEFDPDGESHAFILPLLRPELFLELPPILKALNDALIAKGILPELAESYRIKKGGAASPSAAALSQQLKRLFSPSPEDAAGPGGLQRGASHGTQAGAASAQLFGFLADLQKSMGSHALPGAPGGATPAPMRLAQVKQQIPQGAMSRVDETTIDLLTKVFDTVFQDKNIPAEIKELIGFLQIPVLKAALIDKEFFFEEAHPARRLIEVLTKSGFGWDQAKGDDDPLYQSMKRNVDRVRLEVNQEASLFSDVVSDLESFIAEEETAASEALAVPITQALKREKLRVATKSAESEVAVRVATGEVVTFVEAFLEKRWVPILTLAYSVKEEKPHVLENAVKTMDDLIWSVKPKFTAEERKELISKLPSLLAALNKWITLMKWDDADRMQFFADLAECHASIVRAPLEISPQRQLELAVEAAQRAADKRRAQRANVEPEPVADEFVETVDTLERGVWLNFRQKDGSDKNVKLAWVSPLRSLYIFTTSQKKEAFSLAAEDLAQAFRDERAQIVVLDRFVDRALTQALVSGAGVNDEPAAEQIVA